MAGEEKRLLPRFSLEIPVVLRLSDSETNIHTKSSNVSAGGIFFYVNYGLAASQELELTMTLPKELTRTFDVQVCCKATVVRTEQDPITGRVGIAAAIHSYDFLAEPSSNPYCGTA